MNKIVKILDKDLSDAYDAISRDVSVTWYKPLYTFENGDKLCLVASMMDFDGDGYDGYMKLAILPKNAGMSEYDMDFVTPYNPVTGDTYDTESGFVEHYSADDVNYWNEEARSIVDMLEHGELVANSRKLLKSSEDKEKYWGAFGEDGCVEFLTREEFIDQFGEEPKDEDALDYVDSGCHGKDKKDKKKKPVQSMARGYLQPQYDGRASFYNKAEFDDDKLYSYGTLVAEIVDGKPVLYPDWDYSATTIRHVREFLRQHGFTADSKAQIAKDYLTNARKPVKSSMSVEELPREALQELKQRYYVEKYDEDLSYGELADIDDIVSDEEVFDEYGGTSFTEDDFFCLANSRKPVKSSMPGKEKGIQAIMDEYGCTREEAIEIMNEEIQNSRKPVKSSMVPDVSDEDLRFFAGIASSALDDIYDLYDRDEDTLSRHGYTTSDIDRAQRIASTIWNIII